MSKEIQPLRVYNAKIKHNTAGKYDRQMVGTQGTKRTIITGVISSSHDPQAAYLLSEVS